MYRKGQLGDASFLRKEEKILKLLQSLDAGRDALSLEEFGRQASSSISQFDRDVKVSWKSNNFEECWAMAKQLAVRLSSVHISDSSVHTRDAQRLLHLEIRKASQKARSKSPSSGAFT